MSSTAALNSKCLNLSWLRLPLICRWRSCVPLTAKNSVFWKHLNFFFLEITKKTYFQLFMDMVFPHTGWEGVVWPALANVKMQMAKIGPKLLFREVLCGALIVCCSIFWGRGEVLMEIQRAAPQRRKTPGWTQLGQVMWLVSICLSDWSWLVNICLSLSQAWGICFIILHANKKHCQRHNGPEGWVLLTKVTRSYINLDQISKSQPSISISTKL